MEKISLVYCNTLIHDEKGYHINDIIFKKPVKLRQIRILKMGNRPHPSVIDFISITNSAINKVYCFVKDIKSENFVKFLEIKIQQETKDNDLIIPTGEHIITNHIVIWGEYHNLSLCIYGDIQDIDETQIVGFEGMFERDLTLKPNENDLKLLETVNFQYQGLYRWYLQPAQEEDQDKLESFRIPIQNYLNGYDKNFKIKNLDKVIDLVQCNPEEVSKIKGEAQEVVSQILEGLKAKQKIENYSNFLSLMLSLKDQLESLYDRNSCFMPYTPSDWNRGELIDSKMQQNINLIILQTLQGKILEASEIKISLQLLQSFVMNSSNIELFCKSNGIQILLEILNETTKNYSSILYQHLWTALEILTGNPTACTHFFKCEIQVISYEDFKSISPKSSSPEPEKKRKKQVQMTGYNFLHYKTQQLSNPKLMQIAKVCMNKLNLYLQHERLNSLMKQQKYNVAEAYDYFEILRRNLKCRLLLSSSKFHTLTYKSKHDLQVDQLLEVPKNMESLKHLIQFNCQTIISKEIALLWTKFNFVPNMLSIILDPQVREQNADEFRRCFLAVSDMIITILKAEGGCFYLFQNYGAEVSIFVDFLQSISNTSGDEEQDLFLLEEDTLHKIITYENMPSTSRQLAEIIKSYNIIIKQLDQVSDNDIESLSQLYGFINSVQDHDQEQMQKIVLQDSQRANQNSCIPKQVVYYLFKNYPYILIHISKQFISMLNAKSQISTFYVIQILLVIMKADKTSEISLQIANPLIQILQDNILSQVPQSKQAGIQQLIEYSEIIIQYLKPVTQCENNNLISPLIASLMTLFEIESLQLQIDTANKDQSKEQEIINSQVCQSSLYDITKVDVNYFGISFKANSQIITLLSLLRFINTLSYASPILAIQITSEGFLRIAKKMLIQIFKILYKSYYTQVWSVKNNDREEREQREQEHIEAITYALNIVNLIFSRLLITELNCFSDVNLVEVLINIHALLDKYFDKYQFHGQKETRNKIKKLQRQIQTTFILWAQFPDFWGLYLTVMFENVIHFPNKHASTLNLICCIFEHAISYKDDTFILKGIQSVLTQQPILFPRSMVNYFLVNSKSEDKQKTLKN